MLRRLRNVFFAGLLLILPVITTITLVKIAFQWVDGLLAEPMEKFLKIHLPGFGLVLVVLIIMLTGFVATNLLGKKLIVFFERLVRRIPLIGGIYGTIKQITQALTSTQKTVFRSVVLVEYPRKGAYTAGFVIGEPLAELKEKNGKRFLAVYVPTVPNPTSGYLINVPAEETEPLDLSVEEALQYFISVGMVRPDLRSRKK